MFSCEGTELAANISAVFDEQFTQEKVEAEVTYYSDAKLLVSNFNNFIPYIHNVQVSYFRRKFGNHFERPYGWAWLLKLQAELEKNAQVTLITMIAAVKLMMM